MRCIILSCAYTDERSIFSHKWLHKHIITTICNGVSDVVKRVHLWTKVKWFSKQRHTMNGHHNVFMSETNIVVLFVNVSSCMRNKHHCGNGVVDLVYTMCSPLAS